MPDLVRCLCDTEEGDNAECQYHGVAHWRSLSHSFYAEVQQARAYAINLLEWIAPGVEPEAELYAILAQLDNALLGLREKAWKYEELCK